jgi:hypothetical protein
MHYMDNIKMDHEKKFQGMDWIHLAEDKVQ